ncbi:MAG TPA: Gfo/Idh/MocA family oxidoreductase [Cyclobacteriaceae bacterium]|nr:Gfo/Idh/MocA family oxidoreductase [Cyclobacteriaceae bacterium]
MNRTRRDFLSKSGKIIAGASLIPTITPFSISAGGKISANEKVIVGLIGCNGMGFEDLKNFLKIPGVECAALCDVDQGVLDRRNADLAKLGGKKAELFNDYRKLIDRKDIDVVIIGSPDHWHCLPLVNSCEAGKDIYCEKPLANSIQECDIMEKAAQKYNRVVQVGQWQRSGPHWKNAIDYVYSGQLGKIRTVKTWAYQGWMKPVPVLADEPAPQGVDYDFWLGPATQRPFNRNRFHFNFRWFWDYAGGLMTDWGVHIIDFGLLGMKATTPVSVMASGGKFAYPDDASETPDTLQAIYEFDGFTMIWEHATGINGGPFGRDHGVAYIGNNGTLVVDRGGWEVIPEKENGKPKIEAIPVQRGPGGDLELHVRNFIDCIKSRNKPAADISVAANTARVAHMGNIAFKTGRKIYWDKSSNQFSNDQKANELIKANYRSPWKFPVV